MDNSDKGSVVYTLYRLGKILLIIGLIAVPLYYMGAFDRFRPYLYCHFKKATGIYCPGCGGVRAVDSLLRFQILKSLYYHPAVIYFGIIYLYIMIRIFLQIHLKVRPVKEKTVYLLIYIGIGLIFLQWILKLIVLIFFHKKWIP
ncbi:MAG: DUF2752 domain-containing protein [Lachnospiraceae bacterium]|nr:DUF2752 domain-containing protein [Lachnospiraceae bacterium]